MFVSFGGHFPAHHISYEHREPRSRPRSPRGSAQISAPQALAPGACRPSLCGASGQSCCDTMYRKLVTGAAAAIRASSEGFAASSLVLPFFPFAIAQNLPSLRPSRASEVLLPHPRPFPEAHLGTARSPQTLATCD